MPLGLTVEQKQAAKEILETLDKPTYPRIVVVLTGLSGTGKSTTLETIRPKISAMGAMIVPPNFLFSPTNEELINAREEPFVTEGTPAQIENLRRLTEERYPGLEIDSVTLPGMDLPSSIAHIRALRQAQPKPSAQALMDPERLDEAIKLQISHLPDEQVAAHSLGIVGWMKPLIDVFEWRFTTYLMLLGHGLQEDIDKKVSPIHSIQDLVKPYLKVPLFVEIIQYMDPYQIERRPLYFGPPFTDYRGNRLIF